MRGGDQEAGALGEDEDEGGDDEEVGALVRVVVEDVGGYAREEAAEEGGQREEGDVQGLLSLDEGGGGVRVVVVPEGLCLGEVSVYISGTCFYNVVDRWIWEEGLHRARHYYHRVSDINGSKWKGIRT